MPFAVGAADSEPLFQLVDGWDGELNMMAPPPGKGPGGGGGGDGGSGAQVTDWGVTRLGGVASGSGIIVAVLDTGVDASHPDLAGVVTHCFSGIDRGAFDCGNKKVSDHDGHGTHVAGTIAALDNSGDAVGLAQGVEIWNGKVLGRRGGATSDIVWAMNYAVDNGADIISMSLGGDFSGYPSLQQQMDDAVAYANANGVIVVAAAGNEGTCESGDTQYSWPAMSPGVFTVGATGIVDASGFVTTYTGAEDDVMPCFSNEMPNGVVDVSAPGVYITSLKKGGGITEMSGTSMATPYVSAALAILMAGGMSATQAQNYLVSNAIDMGYPSTLQGAGLIQL